MSPVLLLALAAITGPTRPFHLGFTPFPFDYSLEAVDFAYASIAKDADLILHHLDQGIPWDEALRDAPFPNKVQTDWTEWARRSPKGHAVYLALTPLNLGRDGLATDLSDTKNPEWGKRPFDDPTVEKAFLNYCHRAIAIYHPNYLAIGVESNLVRSKAPDKWEGYLRLHRFIYKTLKAEHPDLPIFDTVVGTALLSGYAPEYKHEDQMKALDDLMPTCDVFAVSIYPYMSAYTTDYIPENMFPELEKMGHGKPMAMAESGYPAKEFSIQSGKLVFHGTEEKQANWVRRVLDAADKGRYLFVVNYITRDYDPLWEKYGRTDLFAIWKNIGFYDAAGKARSGLAIWREALAKPYHR
jgi:hypothetical protein